MDGSLRSSGLKGLKGKLSRRKPFWDCLLYFVSSLYLCTCLTMGRGLRHERLGAGIYEPGNAPGAQLGLYSILCLIFAPVWQWGPWVRAQAWKAWVQAQTIQAPPPGALLGLYSILCLIFAPVWRWGPWVRTLAPPQEHSTDCILYYLLSLHLSDGEYPGCGLWHERLGCSPALPQEYR